MRYSHKKRKIDKYKLPKACPYCKQKYISLIETKQWGYKYVCDICKASVGCHRGTKEPLGCLANEELKEIRNKIHTIIDMLWDDQISRKKVYSKLGKEYGRPFHVAFLNLKRARFVLSDLEKKFSYIPNSHDYSGSAHRSDEEEWFLLSGN